MTSLTNTAEITCQWTGETCTILSITRVTQPNEAITVAGKPANYVNTARMEISLYKIRPYLDYIPAGAFYTFQHASSFGMSSSSPKTTLLTNSFVNCNSLDFLSIQDANIVNIPEGFAQACTNIKTLMLINAGIDTIDKNAFKGLTNLESLYMKNNRLTCLPPDLFQSIPNVKFMDLQSNKIKAIDSRLFRNLPALHGIEMRLNLISYLPTLDFTGSATNGNFGFCLSGNPIYAISPDFCNLFSQRTVFPEDMFDIPNIKCLVNEPGTVIIKKSNCQNSMAIPLQKCYSNWTSSMNAPVTCGPPCPWSSIWKQILDYLKTRV